MSGGGGNSTTTTKTDPPAYLQPFFTKGAEEATALYGRGGTPQYPGNTVAGFSPTTENALDLTQNRALSGSSAVMAGQDFIARGLDGSPSGNPYANSPNMFGSGSNPFLDSTFNKAAGAVTNQVQSNFGSAGRNARGADAQGVATDKYNDLAAQIYGGDYSNERNRQLSYQQQLTGIGASGYESGQDRQQNLLQYGIPYANQDYADLAQLASVGRNVDQLGQSFADDQANRWAYDQNQPGANLDEYIRRLTGFSGSYGQQSGTVPSNSNKLGGAAGGAMLGYQLSGGNPWGAAIGGAGGLIFG